MEKDRVEDKAPEAGGMQFTENQQNRIDAFAADLEEISKKHGCKCVPSVIMSPMGTQYILRVIPDEILNPQIVSPHAGAAPGAPAGLPGGGPR